MKSKKWQGWRRGKLYMNIFIGCRDKAVPCPYTGQQTIEMAEKFRNKYRISSARLQNWDYGWDGAYFITICTKNRRHYFGEIINSEMHLKETGKLAEKFWLEIPDHFPFIELGNFQVMPNHFHGILIIDKMKYDGNNGKNDGENDGGNDGGTADPAVPAVPAPTNKTIGQLRYQNQGSGTISSVLGSYKSIVSKNAHLNNANFAWQSRFHDHIIRDTLSFERIQNYIENNPKNWREDKFYE